MKAYKFLLPGRVSPFAGFIWPEDAWVEADGRLEECRTGVHACRVEDLAWWLTDDLWQVELDGEIARGTLKVLATRGRLVRQVAEWDDAVRGDFAAACAARAAAHAEAGRAAGLPNASRLAALAADAADSARTEPVAVTAYVAAHAAGARTDLAGDPFAAERIEQSAWLARRLGLSGDGG